MSKVEAKTISQTLMLYEQRMTVL